jgi:hypothetical protein
MSANITCEAGASLSSTPPLDGFGASAVPPRHLIHPPKRQDVCAFQDVKRPYVLVYIGPGAQHVLIPADTGPALQQPDNEIRQRDQREGGDKEGSPRHVYAAACSAEALGFFGGKSVAASATLRSSASATMRGCRHSGMKSFSRQE